MKASAGSNLMKKRGAYWFRRRVPGDLADRLGQEITKPLGTKSKREAERRARAYGAKLGTGFAALRAGLRDDIEDPRSVGTGVR